MKFLCNIVFFMLQNSVPQRVKGDSKIKQNVKKRKYVCYICIIQYNIIYNKIMMHNICISYTYFSMYITHIIL